MTCYVTTKGLSHPWKPGKPGYHGNEVWLNHSVVLVLLLLRRRIIMRLVGMTKAVPLYVQHRRIRYKSSSWMGLYFRAVTLLDRRTTWVISKVPHTVRFLFKNEFILQNTFTGLQCNLHCALPQRSNVFGKFCIPVRTPSLLMRLITGGHLIRHLLNATEAFPTEWFLQFWEQVKGWWAHVRNVGKHLPTIFFPKFPILHLWHELGALMYDRWSLREIWLQSVSASISRLRFADHGPRGLPIRSQRSLLESGSQLSRKSERLHHPTGRASAVCRTF